MNQLQPDQQFMTLIQSRLKYIQAGATLQAEQELKPLGLDSMAAVDLLLDLEDTYNVALSDKYLTNETFATAQSLWLVINQLQSTAQ
jgi:acyl carrier protein